MSQIKWDLSSAGHIDINEDPINAAIREMYEELGVKLEETELVLIDTYLNKVKLNEQAIINHFTYLFVVRKNIKINEIKIQKNEVSDIRFINKQDYQDYLKKGMMVEGMKYCDKLLSYIK